MTWEVCNFELPAKEKLRSRTLNFLAVTAGECVKSLATFDLPHKSGVRARDLNFIAVPTFTETEIATFDLPHKSGVRARDLKFIAVSLDCGSEVPGIECVPITLTVDGVGDFGDFSTEDQETHVTTSSYNDDDSFDTYTRTASGSSRTEYTSFVVSAKNSFFNPDDYHVKTPLTSYSSSKSSYANQSAWTTDFSGTYIYPDPSRSYDRSSSSSDSYVFKTNAQSYGYPRKKATLTCDTNFYPVDFIGKYRYSSPFHSSLGWYAMGSTMSYSSITAGSAIRTNNQLFDRIASSVYENNRWNWSSYDYQDLLKFTNEDGGLIESAPRIEERKHQDIYADTVSYGRSLKYNYTDYRGVLSPISYYSKNADITVGGVPIDISRVPVPCSYIADGIIKLDGQEPDRCQVSYVTSSSDGILDSSSLTFDGKAAYPWVYFHNKRGAGSTGVVHTETYSTYSGVYYDGYDQESGSFGGTTNNSLSIQDKVGLTDHSAGNSYLLANNAKEKFKFCLQLGPIFRKRFNKDLYLPGNFSHSYKDANYAEYKYLGFGWGLYLLDFFFSESNSSVIPNTSINDVAIYGPYSYSDHLSEFFEWSGPDWVPGEEVEFNLSGIYGGDISSFLTGYSMSQSLGKYLSFKDKNYKDTERLSSDIEDKFLLPPNKATFLEATHFAGGSGILNYAHAIPEYSSSGTSNLRKRYITYGENNLLLNPFNIVSNTFAPTKDKIYPPEQWNFKDLFIYDRGFIPFGGDYPVEPPADIELVPELIGKPLKSYSYPYSMCEYVELNWNFTEGAWLHSMNREDSNQSKYVKHLWGDEAEIRDYYVFDSDESGYSSDNPNSIFNYPRKEYTIPFGKLTVQKVEPDTVDGLDPSYKFEIQFEWSSDVEEQYGFIYPEAFPSEGHKFSKKSYIQDFDINEPFTQRFHLPNYDDLNLMITNINPNAWFFWLRKLYDLRKEAQDVGNDVPMGIESYKMLYMQPRPTFVEIPEK